MSGLKRALGGTTRDSTSEATASERSAAKAAPAMTDCDKDWAIPDAEAEHTGGSGATDHAGGVDAIEKRTARDGRDYSYQEFEKFYGSERAPSEWHDALFVAVPDFRYLRRSDSNDS